MPGRLGLDKFLNGRMLVVLINKRLRSDEFLNGGILVVLMNRRLNSDIFFEMSKDFVQFVDT